eukprot:16449435-Heterocapsa_arctica.AAC.1
MWQGGVGQAAVRLANFREALPGQFDGMAQGLHSRRNGTPHTLRLRPLHSRKQPTPRWGGHRPA